MNGRLLVACIFALGMGATHSSASIIVVDPYGTGDYPTIQEAIDAAFDGDVIELTDGTFTGDGNRDVDYRGKAITIRSQSGDPESCIIDCEAGEGDLHRGFLFISGETYESILEGISIVNGYWDYSGNGGGIRCVYSSPTITRCNIFWCIAPIGGGIFCDSTSCPTISECVISDNDGVGGGIAALQSSCPLITDCIITRNSGNSGGAIDVDQAEAEIVRCTITGNLGVLGGGVSVRDTSSVRIEDCTIAGNGEPDLPSAFGGGICCERSELEVVGSTITGNASAWGGGVFCHESSVSLTSCTIAGNRARIEFAGGGISCQGSSMTLENTILWGNCAEEVMFQDDVSSMSLRCCDVDPANIFGPGEVTWLDGNIVDAPRFCDPENCENGPTTEGDYRIAEDSPCADAPGCGLIGSLPPGCTSGPRTYVVSPDGLGDFPTIQAAINATADADTIDLADGVFMGDGNRDLNCQGKAITIRSQNGLREVCVIDCEGTPEEFHRGFNFTSGEGRGCVLQGLTITNAYIDEGGGIQCLNGSSPYVKDCVFEGNYADNGAAIFCLSSDPAVADCTFLFNEALAVGGAVLSANSSPLFIGCLFSNNVASYGGAASCIAQYPAFRRCTFSWNSADSGGAIHSTGSSIQITECTFFENAVSGNGAGLFLESGPAPTLENTIIAFGMGGEAIYCTVLAPTLRCCDLYGNEGGDWVGCIADQYGVDHNISEDPLFCDPANEDLRVHSDSPCAWANNPGCGTIGAWPVGCGETASVEIINGAQLRLQCHPSPFTGSTRVHFNVPQRGDRYSVHLSIHDPAGRLIKRLVDAILPPGPHRAVWNGTDAAGRRVANGVYFCRLRGPEGSLTSRVVLLR